MNTLDRRHDALMLSDMDTEPAPLSCPPCNSRCEQGSACPAQAGSACSELLEDNRKPPMTWVDLAAWLVVILCSLGAWGILIDQVLRMTTGGK